MQIPAIGPSASLTPASVASPTATPGTSGSSFSDMLVGQIQNLNQLQTTAAADSQALATGQATDIASVVSDVEKASLAIQLATQVRNKAVDAYQELFRMQV